MKTETSLRSQKSDEHGELLILANGKVLAHNVTPALARVLAALDPDDAAMDRRAKKEDNFTS